MPEIVTTVIDWITQFQLMLLAAALLISKRGRRVSNRMLALFCIIQSTCVFNSIIWRYYDWFYANAPYLFYLFKSFVILVGPALYLYTRSMTRLQFRLSRRDWFNLLPFLIHFSFYFVRFHRFGIAMKRHLLSENLVQTAVQARIMDNLFFITLIVYGVLIVIELVRYANRLKQCYAFPPVWRLGWPVLLLGGFVLVWVIEIFEYYRIWIMGGSSLFFQMAHLFVFILATAMVFKALVWPDSLTELKWVESKYKYILSPKQKKAYLAALKTSMIEKQPYLEPRLTLTDLSKVSDIPPRHLSQILNDELSQNFYDFINSFRVRMVQAYMMDPEKSRKTILEMLYEAGFNSKTAFNTAFKKQTGMTPSDFKRTVSV